MNDWLRWARRMQSIAQDGLTYTRDPYDVERYGRLQALAAEVLAAHSADSANEFQELLAAERGPATPKVDVRAAVFRDDEVLLVKEPEDGLWSLPGGWADIGEPASEAVVRETFEETGYRVWATKLISALDRDRHPHPHIPYHAYKLNFLCELLDGEPAQPVGGPEAGAGAGFFAADALPPLSLSRVLPEQVSRFFEHHRDPTLPTDFD